MSAASVNSQVSASERAAPADAALLFPQEEYGLGHFGGGMDGMTSGMYDPHGQRSLHSLGMSHSPAHMPHGMHAYQAAANHVSPPGHHVMGATTAVPDAQKRDKDAIYA